MHVQNYASENEIGKDATPTVRR